MQAQADKLPDLGQTGSTTGCTSNPQAQACAACMWLAKTGTDVHLRRSACVQAERWGNGQHKASPQGIRLPTAGKLSGHLGHQPAQELPTQPCIIAHASLYLSSAFAWAAWACLADIEVRIRGSAGIRTMDCRACDSAQMYPEGVCVEALAPAGKAGLQPRAHA